MRLTKRQRWMLVAGAASMIGARVAEGAFRQSWRLASRKDPPMDPWDKGMSWRQALAWSAALGAIVSVSELFARHGAAVAWKRATGRRPPEPKRRPRR